MQMIHLVNLSTRCMELKTNGQEILDGRPKTCMSVHRNFLYLIQSCFNAIIPVCLQVQPVANKHKEFKFLFNGNITLWHTVNWGTPYCKWLTAIRSRSCGYSSGFWQNVIGGYPVCQRWKSCSQNINVLLKNWFDQSHFLLLSTVTWLVLCTDVIFKKSLSLKIVQNDHIKFQGNRLECFSWVLNVSCF